MQTYPLHSLNIEEAMKLQFKVVDCITEEFEGHEFLNRGDLGVVMGLNKPVTTSKAEKVIARIFDTEAAMMVRGAGSGGNQKPFLGDSGIVKGICHLHLQFSYIICTVRIKHYIVN